jgi:diadenylate cyclase
MPFSFDFIYHIRWQDYLDIAILSLIIYRILLMLRGTRTIQILAGFLVVAIFYYFAGILNLLGSTWVLNNIFNSIVIVFIVLFQADIRNALAQMGTRTLFHDRSLSQSPDVLDSIYSVCQHLSKSRIGALIVMENATGLRNYYTGATKINAEFSRQLLVTIFDPHTPLHDGAVVISRDKRIAYAGCILPLSKEIDFAKNKGTRHRAALGLSEESDAVILVVSEETGEISLAYNGELLLSSSGYPLSEKLKEIFKQTK